MEKSSEEPHISSASREFPCCIWNMDVHNHVNNSSTHALILIQINPVHAPSHAVYLSSISILFPRLFLGLPICLSSSSIPIKPFTPYSFPSSCHMSILNTALQHRNITNSAATTDPIIQFLSRYSSQSAPTLRSSSYHTTAVTGGRQV